MNQVVATVVTMINQQISADLITRKRENAHYEEFVKFLGILASKPKFGVLTSDGIDEIWDSIDQLGDGIADEITNLIMDLTMATTLVANDNVDDGYAEMVKLLKTSVDSIKTSQSLPQGLGERIEEDMLDDAVVVTMFLLHGCVRDIVNMISEATAGMEPPKKDRE